MGLFPHNIQKNDHFQCVTRLGFSRHPVGNGGYGRTFQVKVKCDLVAKMKQSHLLGCASNHLHIWIRRLGHMANQRKGNGVLSPMIVRHSMDSLLG